MGASTHTRLASSSDAAITMPSSVVRQRDQKPVAGRGKRARPTAMKKAYPMYPTSAAEGNGPIRSSTSS